MNENSNEQAAVREYLLGTLSDELKMREVEEMLLLDDDFEEQLSIAEDELTDEYLSGTLTGPERERFLQFFLISSERKEKLRLIGNLRKYATSRARVEEVKEFPRKKAEGFDWRGLFSSPAWRFAAAALLVLALGFGVWRVAFYQSDTDKGLAQLSLAYSGERLTESRPTINFGYAPFDSTRGNALEAAKEKKRARDRAERLLLDASENQSDAEAHHALGLLYLAEKKIDEALNEFKRALELAPRNAKFHSDLGAVYLEKAVQYDPDKNPGERMENLALSLQSIDRALEIDDSLLEALFNRALVLEKMSVENQAREAWNKYLEKDSASPWADEARRRLENLNRESRAPKDSSQILQDFLDAFHHQDDRRAWEIASQTKELITGVMIQQQLVQKFLKADQESRKEEADEILSAFLYLGKLEKTNNGDLYFAELAGYYSKTSQTQRQELLEAYAKLQEGNNLIKEPNFEAALEILNQSKELFLAAGNVWEAQLVEHRICYSLSRLDKIKESNERLLALSEFSERKSYKWLQTITDIWIAETYYFRGESSKAILYNQKSLKLARATSDTYNTHRVLVQITEVYQTIGDARSALSVTYQNLALTESYHTFPRQKWRDLNYATEVFQRFKFYAAAVAFGKETIDCALNEAKDDWMITIAHRNMAIIYSDLQKFPEAYRQIETNFRVSQTLRSEAVRKRLFANSTQVLGDIQRQTGDCAKAVENYDQAIQTYREMQFSIFEYSARKGKLFCDIAQKNDAGMKEEFAAILQLFDENRENIKEEADRNTFFDIEQNVYDAAIDYAYAKLNDPEQAFNYAENSRARSLLKLVGGDSGASQPLSLTEVRERIPTEVQVAYYAVLKDKIVIWYVSGTKWKAVEKAINEETLENKVADYTRILIEKNDADAVRRAAKELYGLLIKPLETLLEKDKAICIVADKSLFRLPFSSLVSSKTDKYLIEDYTILFAPSAAVFVNETELAKQKNEAQNETVMSIGNPSFSRAEFKLEDLPAARREAEEIALLYDSPKLFTEKTAVKEQVVNNLNEVDVIHFAGHYVANSSSPLFSKLLLAAGDLPVEEIMQQKLSRPRLMVLSACETGVEEFYKGEGMIGAARAFLASNIPLVLASQWSVDSEASSKLMIKFHGYRKQQRLSTIAALRQAQIDMISDEQTHFRQPYYWAGFLPIGGYANY